MRLWGWVAAYTIGLAYVSLIPFRYLGLSPATWWQRVVELPWLDIGVSGRADWIANLVLFIPFGFLLAWASAGRSRRATSRVVVLPALAIVLLALVIETIQPQFAPRTASLNDILAGCVGGAIGLAVWLLAGGWIVARLKAAGRPGLRGASAALRVYSVAYVLLALFPYDFVTDLGELSQRLEARPPALVFAECVRATRCLAGVVLEALSVAPIGAWLAMRAYLAGRRFAGRRAILLGLALGAALEAIQLLLFSGVTQGASVLAKGFGAWLGAVLLLHALNTPEQRLLRQLRWAAVLCLPPYLVLFMMLSGLPGTSWSGIDAAMEKLQSLSFLPFYYHYFTTEADAAASLVYHLALYMPVGLAIWPWRRCLARPALAAGVAAGLLALAVESAKLLAEDLRPDPTTILVAIGGALLGYLILGRLFTVLRQDRGPPVDTSSVGTEHAADPAAADRTSAGAPPGSAASVLAPGTHEGDGTVPAPRPSWPARVGALGLLVGAAMAALGWPAGAPWLTLGLAFYAAWLYRDCSAWLLVLPAVVPLLNMAPLTGRYMVTELDLLLLVTVAISLWALPGRRGGGRLPGFIRLVLLAYSGSWALALFTALWPPPALDATAFSTYASPLNVLRVGKGFGWALLLYVACRRLPQSSAWLLERRVAPGMTLGLAGLVAVVAWERATYPGLLDFAAPYRVTGLFADMHVGGPTIEAYIALSLPFAVFWLWRYPTPARLLMASPLLAGALYALFVTYSRAGYAAVLAGLVVLAVGLAPAGWRRGGRWRFAGVPLVALPLALIVAVTTQATEGFLGQRMYRLAGDLEARIGLWQEALAAADGSVATAVLGHGLGAYPRLAQRRALLQGERIPENFSHARDGEDAYLRLGPGESLYVAQRVSLARDAGYSVHVRARRGTSVEAALLLFVCEAHLGASLRCQRQALAVDAPPDRWGHYTAQMHTGNLGGGPWFARRQLAFSVAQRGAGLVEVERIRLQHERTGHEPIRNGDFGQGLRHWYYVVDDFSSWRTENQWLETYVEQGIVGAAAFTLLVLLGSIRLLRRTLAGETTAVPVLAAVTGTLTIGMAATVFWSPRVATLFWLILLIALRQGYPSPGERPGRPGSRLSQGWEGG